MSFLTLVFGEPSVPTKIINLFCLSVYIFEQSLIKTLYLQALLFDGVEARLHMRQPEYLGGDEAC